MTGSLRRTGRIVGIEPVEGTPVRPVLLAFKVGAAAAKKGAGDRFASYGTGRDLYTTSLRIARRLMVQGPFVNGQRARRRRARAERDRTDDGTNRTGRVTEGKGATV